MFNINNSNPMPSLLEPYVKVTVGKLGDKNSDVFQTGDGKLQSCSVFLGEGKATSKCTFKIYDPDKKITDKYFKYIESVDGLDPIEPPSTEKGNITDNTFNSEAPVDGGEPGKIVYNNVKATVYDPAKGGINGNIRGGAYKADLPKSELDANGNIKWATGFYAAMFNTTYKLAQMRVTNLDNGKSVIVKVVDRGPFKNGGEDPERKIDLTPSAYNQICTTGQSYPPGGVVNNVKIEWVKAQNTTSSTSNKEESANNANKEIKKDTASGTIAAGIDSAKASINKAANPIIETTVPSQTLAGAQITIELGFSGKTLVAYSFIHTSLNYSMESPHSLEFGGQAANWVLTQRSKNTVYTNMTFKKIAEKITSSYGLKLEMEDEGPKYDYFPQRGRTDYDTLLIEARRLGYRVYTKGATLYIRSREQITASKDIFVQEYGFNMGESFEVNHSAMGSSSGGARSAEPNNQSPSTGERKFEIDENKGTILQQVKESIVGTGADSQQATTGSVSIAPTPLVSVAAEGTANIDAQRKSNEDRIKGITATTSFPTTPEVLLVDPDTPYRTKGLSEFLDRYWVVDNIEHVYDAGTLKTKLLVYSPLKNKRPASKVDNSGGEATIDNSAITGDIFDPSTPSFIKPLAGTFTSPFGMRRGRMHNGVDISSVGGNGPGGTIKASASGVATVILGNNGGYGNTVEINHGGGWLTRYAHMFSISIANGATVSQGQALGIEGNSGASRGTHLHFEIRKNGTAVNPAKYIKL